MRTVLLPLAFAACSPAPQPAPIGPQQIAAPSPDASARSTAGSVAAPPSAESSSGPDAGGAPTTAITGAEAEDVIFPDAPTDPARNACRASGDDRAHVRCLIGLRFGADPRGRDVAVDLFDATGSVVGVERPQLFDGGWRGTIRLVPELPSGPASRHLGFIAAALQDHDRFFAALAAVAPSLPRYRWRDLSVRVFRSVGRTTPSAYATGWTVAYNVAGSLNGSADAVRETLFHEVFHLNDEAHGGWSARALTSLRDAIVARCGARTPCLAPYAPGDTQVRGGTYYAFQPGNPVEEYAAELAVRYHREQLAALGLSKGRAGHAAAAPFKCGPPENELAWSLIRAEFFGGADRTPPCPGPRGP